MRIKEHEAAVVSDVEMDDTNVVLATSDQYPIQESVGLFDDYPRESHIVVEEGLQKDERHAREAINDGVDYILNDEGHDNVQKKEKAMQEKLFELLYGLDMEEKEASDLEETLARLQKEKGKMVEEPTTSTGPMEHDDFNSWFDAEAA